MSGLADRLVAASKIRTEYGYCTIHFDELEAAAVALRATEHLVPVHCNECGRDQYMNLKPTGPLPDPPKDSK